MHSHWQRKTHGDLNADGTNGSDIHRRLSDGVLADTRESLPPLQLWMMNSMLKGVIVGFLAAIVAAALCAYIAVITGTVPAAADAKPVLLEHWAARTSLRATLARNAPKGPNPVPLTEANLIAGIELFSQHCAACHGTAKGDASASPIAKGEYPSPPQMASEGVEDDPDGWTFWKIENGIRWTGMPSWKATLNPHEIWTITLFLKNMDKLPAGAKVAWQQIKN
jgi:thiosulfate dehydrogenase